MIWLPSPCDRSGSRPFSAPHQGGRLGGAIHAQSLALHELPHPRGRLLDGDRVHVSL
jgi:hypothetical protein